MSEARTIPGIHHVTAISGPPQANVDFYTGRLGQRLVKKTVNFDDPGTYHLYYGDRDASPGTILTFFPFAGAGPGRAGPGMAQAYAYAVPKGRFDDWVQQTGADAADPPLRFGQRVLTLRDPDGAPVELIETDRRGDAALDGFHSVTLWLDDPEPTARLLTGIFGYQSAGSDREESGERLRFAAPGGARGSVIDLLRVDGSRRGQPGTGTIHHVAFRAESDAVQAEWRSALAQAGHQVTPVIDRQYFNAIYFREPGGVLFEIATDSPGFAIDEPASHLGKALKLPPQYEPHRARIEAALPPLQTP